MADFDVAVPDVDEALPSMPPDQAVRRLAARKARAVEGDVVLGADTLVALDGDVMGKPAGLEEAAVMLTRLDGHEHEVVTGVAVRRGQQVTVDSAGAVVRLELGAAGRAGYLESGAWQGKAGAYGLQDEAIAASARLVSGPWSAVVGLPLDTTARLLRDAGVAVQHVPGEEALAAHNPFSTRSG